MLISITPSSQLRVINSDHDNGVAVIRVDTSFCIKQYLRYLLGIVTEVPLLQISMNRRVVDCGAVRTVSSASPWRSAMDYTLPLS